MLLLQSQWFYSEIIQCVVDVGLRSCCDFTTCCPDLSVFKWSHFGPTPTPELPVCRGTSVSGWLVVHGESQELLPGLGVLQVNSQHGARHRAAVHLLHAAHHHAHVPASAQELHFKGRCQQFFQKKTEGTQCKVELKKIQNVTKSTLYFIPMGNVPLN